MTDHLDLILTITGGLTAALVLGYITQQLKLSPIVGYLLAGIAVGRHTPGFEADQGIANQLAEIGVILLMFGVGLHFHLHELLSVRKIAIPGAIIQSIVATLLGAVAGWAFGWGWTTGVVYGLAISVASTVVLVRVLTDNKDLHTPTGHIAVGWLVVEDLFTVVVLVLLPALANFELSKLPITIGLAALKIAALVAFAFLVGGRIIPWLLDRVAKTQSRELFTLTILVVALGIAVGSAKVFGVSMALGAFLAGMVVARSEFSSRAAADALPMRDAFAVLFFVSVGMLFNPYFLIERPWIVAVTLAIVLIGKPLTALVLVILLKYPIRVALSVAIVLGQIGEFSFILAQMARDLHIMGDDPHNALIAAAIVSISINPLIYRLVDPLEAYAARQGRLWRWFNARLKSGLPANATSPADGDLARISRHRAVVIGYGPVGRTVTRLLGENDIIPTVIEMNVETVRHLREQGISAIYGDATHLDTLQNAGVEQAVSLILSASGIHGSEDVIRQARQLNPNIRVLARSAYVRELDALRNAGAQSVFSGEGEVALALTTTLLRDLGATSEQIERERNRVQDELFGKAPDPSVADG